ncbi:MAG: hypothetical protein A3H96_03985 [Acidobacteria bacterium RIFCSPLOWO2_02_FULL_67_36]|nr:MAG: hypothetical protein A3H96_03985 [Acidobacteria bacterium RIFCSPLOWO2_02_FULL_67_36]OFW20020.1 MAG: hypothetical protein A3G21_07050 [Acidobacteria bacterium RIFCSPLOWO2_12_FULL_66_21]
MVFRTMSTGWYVIGVHGLWVIALAIIVAAVGWHDWRRDELGRPRSRYLGLASFQLPLNLGLLLIALSFALMTTSAWWERTIWAALGVFFGRGAFAAGQSWRRDDRRT